MMCRHPADQIPFEQFMAPIDLRNAHPILHRHRGGTHHAKTGSGVIMTISAVSGKTAYGQLGRLCHFLHWHRDLLPPVGQNEVGPSGYGSSACVRRSLDASGLQEVFTLHAQTPA